MAVDGLPLNRVYRIIKSDVGMAQPLRLDDVS